MNLSRREEASQPTPQEARSRQTAYEATEHWWKSRVAALAAEWHERAEVFAAQDNEYAQGVEYCADKLEALIAERERP